MEKIMSFYPSDEYDSSDLERELPSRTKRQFRHWLIRGPHGDDDDPPPVPAAARRPTPPPSLMDAAAEAA
jgi:hypothetical protein